MRLRVLLVGFGDLAQRLAPRLLADGWQVTGLRRSPMVFPGVAMISGDCRDSHILAEAVADQDLIVVTLTPAQFTEDDYRSTYEDGARAINAAITAQVSRPKHVLWISSTSVYGQSIGECVDESSETLPRGFSGRSLLAAETLIAQGPVPATAVRFSGIYGPGRNRTLNQIRAGLCAPETPVQWSNRIHSEDCAGVLRHLAAMAMKGQPLSPVYLATDCEPAPLHSVHRWLAQQLRVEVGDAQGASAAVRGNRRCSNRLLLDTGYRFLYPSFREGYREMIC